MTADVGRRRQHGWEGRINKHPRAKLKPVSFGQARFLRLARFCPTGRAVRRRTASFTYPETFRPFSIFPLPETAIKRGARRVPARPHPDTKNPAPSPVAGFAGTAICGAPVQACFASTYLATWTLARLAALR